MAEPFATVDDLRARFERPLSPDEAARAAVLLADASEVIRSDIAGLPNPPPGVVVPIVCAMVARLLRNPAGIRSETIGGYSYTTDDPSGLYLTDAERALLIRPLTTAFTITPTHPSTT